MATWCNNAGQRVCYMTLPICFLYGKGRLLLFMLFLSHNPAKIRHWDAIRGGIYEKSVWLTLLMESCQCCSHLRLVFEVSWFTTTCPFLHATCGREDINLSWSSWALAQLCSLPKFTASNIYSTYLQIIPPYYLESAVISEPVAKYLLATIIFFSNLIIDISHMVGEKRTSANVLH